MYIIVLYDQSNHICLHFSDLNVYKAYSITWVVNILINVAILPSMGVA